MLEATPAEPPVAFREHVPESVPAADFPPATKGGCATFSFTCRDCCDCCLPPMPPVADDVPVVDIFEPTVTACSVVLTGTTIGTERSDDDAPPVTTPLLTIKLVLDATVCGTTMASWLTADGGGTASCFSS